MSRRLMDSISVFGVIWLVVILVVALLVFPTHYLIHYHDKPVNGRSTARQMAAYTFIFGILMMPLFIVKGFPLSQWGCCAVQFLFVTMFAAAVGYLHGERLKKLRQDNRDIFGPTEGKFD